LMYRDGFSQVIDKKQDYIETKIDEENYIYYEKVTYVSYKTKNETMGCAGIIIGNIGFAILCNSIFKKHDLDIKLTNKYNRFNLVLSKKI